MSRNMLKAGEGFCQHEGTFGIRHQKMGSEFWTATPCPAISLHAWPLLFFAAWKEQKSWKIHKEKYHWQGLRFSMKIGSSRTGFAAAWELRILLSKETWSEIPAESQQGSGLNFQVSVPCSWEIRVMWDPSFWFTANSTSMGFCLCLLKWIKCHIWIFSMSETGRLLYCQWGGFALGFLKWTWQKKHTPSRQMFIKKGEVHNFTSWWRTK